MRDVRRWSLVVGQAMPDRSWNALYLAAYRCQVRRSQVVLSSSLARDRAMIPAAYDAWLANGEDARVRLSLRRR